MHHAAQHSRVPGNVTERTHAWALRCVAEHQRLTREHPDKPPQMLLGWCRAPNMRICVAVLPVDSLSLDFDGFGIGGALEKENLGTIVRWVNEELPDDKPRHLLGISEPDDLFTAIENGADTFDCVTPSRVGRNAALYRPDGRFNVTRAANRRDFSPVDADCDCYTCAHYTCAYLHHLFRAKEMVANTLATIHNERFIVRLVDQIRASIVDGTFYDFRDEFLGTTTVAPESRRHSDGERGSSPPSPRRVARSDARTSAHGV